MKINSMPDCGNSPKKEFLKRFNLAFAQGDAEFLIEHVSEDIVWEMFGDKKIQGKEAFAKEVRAMADYTADEISIHHIITHGKEGSLNGEFIMGESRYAFSDVYVFESAGKNIIKRLYSYVVQLEW